MESTKKPEQCSECLWWIENGDGTQRFCEICDQYEPAATAAAAAVATAAAAATTVAVAMEKDGENERDTPSTATISVSSLRSSAPPNRKRRKFLSRQAFDEKADDKTKRRIAPIQKWRDLIVGNVYRVCKIHDIMVNIKGQEQLSHYGEFQDANEQLINAWLTTIIYDELVKHKKLSEGNVFLKPLGKKKSMKSGMDYHDFVVVVNK